MSRRRTASVTPLDAAAQCRLTMGREGWSLQLESREEGDGRTASFNPGRDIPAPWGELESESYPLCHSTSCPHWTGRETIIRHCATALASGAPPPFLGTGHPAAAKKGDGRAYTLSQLLCSYPAGAKASSITSLSHAAHQTSVGRGMHLCAVPLAEDEAFLVWPVWDAAGEERWQRAPSQLTVPRVSSQRRAQHVGSLQQHQAGTTGQNYSPLGRARTISRLNPSLSHLLQINFKE